MTKIQKCTKCGREIDEHAEWWQDEGWVCGYCTVRDSEEHHYQKTAMIEEAVYEETEYCLS